MAKIHIDETRREGVWWKYQIYACLAKVKIKIKQKAIFHFKQRYLPTAPFSVFPGNLIRMVLELCIKPN